MNKKITVRGELEGEGNELFDEVMLSEEPTYGDTMHYADFGTVKRPVANARKLCEGTKCLTFSSNPRNNSNITEKEFGYLIESTLKCLFAKSDPEAIGRRFGLLLFNNDYLPVKQSSIDDIFGYNDILQPMFSKLISRNELKISKVIKTNHNWLFKEDKDYKKQLKEKRKRIISPYLKTFLKGYESSTQKLRMVVIKKLIIDNFDVLIFSENNDVMIESFKKIISEQAETLLQDYQNLNLESIDKLCFFDKDISDKEKVKAIKKFYGEDISSRRIETMTGIPHSTVDRWLKEEDSILHSPKLHKPIPEVAKEISEIKQHKK